MVTWPVLYPESAHNSAQHALFCLSIMHAPGFIIIILCVYVCMHVCIYACMYVCMHVCMYVYMHVCMYVCMYVFHDAIHVEGYVGEMEISNIIVNFMELFV